MGSVTSNEPPRYLQGITNDSSFARRIKRDVGIAFRRNKRKKKMHCTICLWYEKVQKVQKVQGKIFILPTSDVGEKKKEKPLGESGDIGDIAKIVNIAMQKNGIRKVQIFILPTSDVGEKKKETACSDC